MDGLEPDAGEPGPVDRSRHLPRLPVLARGKLKGIITDSDFVAVAINLLEQLEDSEPFEKEEEEEYV